MAATTTTATAAPRPLANSYTAGKLPRWTPWVMLVASWVILGAVFVHPLLQHRRGPIAHPDLLGTAENKSVVD